MSWLNLYLHRKNSQNVFFFPVDHTNIKISYDDIGCSVVNSFVVVCECEYIFKKAKLLQVVYTLL